MIDRPHEVSKLVFSRHCLQIDSTCAQTERCFMQPLSVLVVPWAVEKPVRLILDCSRVAVAIQADTIGPGSLNTTDCSPHSVDRQTICPASQLSEQTCRTPGR